VVEQKYEDPAAVGSGWQTHEYLGIQSFLEVFTLHISTYFNAIPFQASYHPSITVFLYGFLEAQSSDNSVPFQCT
jgi:hypothetical protein